MGEPRKHTFVATIVTILVLPTLCAMQEPTEAVVQKIVDKTLKQFNDRIVSLHENLNNSTNRLNESMALAYHGNEAALKAYQQAQEATATLNATAQQIKNVTEASKVLQDQQEQLREHNQKATADLTNHYQGLIKALEDQFSHLASAAAQKTNPQTLHDKIEATRALIKEKKAQKIYEEAEKIKAQALVEVEKERWGNIKQIITDPVVITKVIMTLTLIILSFYLIKYGIPWLLDYYAQPHVISETSQAWWFWPWHQHESINLDDLIFEPPLQLQLHDLLLRVQYAKDNNLPLPNILFHGVSGTGKTAMAKALAYQSGLDYAITSGSEFAKIADASIANDELRSLIAWAEKSSKGVVIFIDEAESLFVSRQSAASSKQTEDFIDTFLSLISEQSQKKIMFVFATNHPYKLDSAIINRIGTIIEFTLPKALERKKIIERYLTKLAHEHNVYIHGNVIEKLPQYAELLEGFAPRTLKFLSEEMVITAQRQQANQLTLTIADALIASAQHSLQQITAWQTEHTKQEPDSTYNNLRVLADCIDFAHQQGYSYETIAQTLNQELASSSTLQDIIAPVQQYHALFRAAGNDTHTLMPPKKKEKRTFIAETTVLLQLATMLTVMIGAYLLWKKLPWPGNTSAKPPPKAKATEPEQSQPPSTPPPTSQPEQKIVNPIQQEPLPPTPELFNPNANNDKKIQWPFICDPPRALPNKTLQTLVAAQVRQAALIDGALQPLPYNAYTAMPGDKQRDGRLFRVLIDEQITCAKKLGYR